MNRMTAEHARNVRAQGHADARRFAELIGLPDDYQNNPHAKKDVIDLNGDAHSVKSGKLKWQIFMYKENRFCRGFRFRRDERNRRIARRLFALSSRRICGIRRKQGDL